MILKGEINTFFNLLLGMMEDKLRELSYESESDEIEAMFIRIFDMISGLECAEDEAVFDACLAPLLCVPQLEEAVKKNRKAAYKALCFCTAAGWLSLHPVLAVSEDALLVGCWMYRDYRPADRELSADEISIEASDAGGLLLAVSAAALTDHTDCAFALTEGCDRIRKAEWGRDIFWDFTWKDMQFVNRDAVSVNLSDYIAAEDVQYREQTDFYQAYQTYGTKMKQPHLLLQKALCQNNRYKELLAKNILSQSLGQMEPAAKIGEKQVTEFLHQVLCQEQAVLVIADADAQDAFCREYQKLFGNLNFLTSAGLKDISGLKEAEIEIINREAAAEDPRFQFQKRRFEELKKRLKQSEELLLKQTETGKSVAEIWEYLENNPCEWSGWPKKINAQQKDIIFDLCSQWEKGMLSDCNQRMLRNMLTLKKDAVEKLSELLSRLGEYGNYIIRSKKSFLESVGITYTTGEESSQEQLNLLYRLVCLYDAFREVDLCRREPEEPDENKKKQLARYQAFTEYQKVCECLAHYQISTEKAEAWLLENRSMIAKYPDVFNGKQNSSILRNPVQAQLSDKICELAGCRRGSLKEPLEHIAKALYYYEQRKEAAAELEEEERKRYQVIWEKMTKKREADDADIFSAWYRLAKEYIRCMAQSGMPDAARKQADYLIRERIEAEQPFTEKELAIFAEAENLFDAMEITRESKDGIFDLLEIKQKEWEIRMRGISYLDCFSEWNVSLNAENLYQKYQDNLAKLDSCGLSQIWRFWENEPYAPEAVRENAQRSYLQEVFETACEEVHLNLSLYQNTKKSYEAIELQLLASKERELNNSLLIRKKRLYEENSQLLDAIFEAEDATAFFLKAGEYLKKIYPVILLDPDSAENVFAKAISQKEGFETVFEHLLFYKTEDTECSRFLYPLLLSEEWNTVR